MFLQFYLLLYTWNKEEKHMYNLYFIIKQSLKAELCYIKNNKAQNCDYWVAGALQIINGRLEYYVQSFTVLYHE